MNVIGLFKFLAPPHEGESPKLHDWRILVSAVQTALIVVLSFHVGASMGWLPYISSGFALAADVNETKAEIIEQKLYRAHASLCMRQGDIQLIEYVGALEDRYLEAAGREYEALPCDLLLKIQAP